MKPEFEIGQEVTYTPYEKRLKAIVKGTIIDRGEIKYRLTSVESAKWHEQVNAITSGRCIEESKLFEPYKPGEYFFR